MHNVCLFCNKVKHQMVPLRTDFINLRRRPVRRSWWTVHLKEWADETFASVEASTMFSFNKNKNLETSTWKVTWPIVIMLFKHLRAKSVKVFPSYSCKGQRRKFHNQRKTESSGTRTSGWSEIRRTFGRFCLLRRLANSIPPRFSHFR